MYTITQRSRPIISKKMTQMTCIALDFRSSSDPEDLDLYDKYMGDIPWPIGWPILNFFYRYPVAGSLTEGIFPLEAGEKTLSRCRPMKRKDNRRLHTHLTPCMD